MWATDRVPFLFLHGAGGTKSKWRLVQERLSSVGAEYVDLPGHGTDSGLAATSIEKCAEMLSPTIHQDMMVVGHSMGGLIGIELAMRNKHVKGLVLVSSHYTLPVHPTVLSQLAEGGFPESLFYASYNKQASKELLEQELAELSLVSQQTAFLDFDSCNAYSGGKEAFSRLEIPILALYGSSDRLLPRTAMEDAMAANPRVSTRVVQDSSHYIMLEQPGEFVRALLHFHDATFREA